ncbi:MAG: hypothetical protein NVS3B19_10170 [Ginsengibacter sp.]
MFGTEGRGFITTVVVADRDAQLLTVVTSVYVPAFIISTLLTVGFCNSDVNLLGPVQLYDAPEIRLVLRIKFDPTHNGPLFEIVGATGIGLIITFVIED